MGLTRRKFLGITIAAGTGIIIGGNYYLNNEEMSKPKKKEGMVLADLHVHINKKEDLEDIAKVLSKGLTALTTRNDDDNILSYNDVINNGFFKKYVKEIDKGFLAEFNYNGDKGYIVKGQEISSHHHILSIGHEENITERPDTIKVVEDIKKKNGLAIPAHIYGLNSRVFPRLINKKEEVFVSELCEMVDEIEVFNGFAINLLPDSFQDMEWLPSFLRMKNINENTKKLADKYGFKGIACSDAHRMEQVHTSGIYIKENGLNMSSLIDYIKNGEFERFEQYISRWSVIKSIIL